MYSIEGLCCVVMYSIEGLCCVVMYNCKCVIGCWEDVLLCQVWEQGTYKQLSTLMGHSGTVYALSALQTASGTKVFSASYDRSLRVSSVSLQSLSVGLSAVVMQSCSSSHGSVFLCLLFCYLCLWWWVLACWNHWWELACWNQPTVSAVVQFFWSVHVHGYCFFCCCNFSFLFFFLVFFLYHYTPFSKGQGCFFV